MKKTILASIALLCVTASVITFSGCSDKNSTSSVDAVEHTTESTASIEEQTTTSDESIEATKHLKFSKKNDLPENYGQTEIEELLYNTYNLNQLDEIELKCTRSGSDNIYTWYDFNEFYKGTQVYFANARVLVYNNADEIEVISTICSNNENHKNCLPITFKDKAEKYSTDEVKASLGDDYNFVESCYLCKNNTAYYCYKFENIKEFVFVDTTDLENIWKSPTMFTADKES